jgi:Na+-transporting NADH:ubiquinone oxidoreductase subunit NqrA
VGATGKTYDGPHVPAGLLAAHIHSIQVLMELLITTHILQRGLPVLHIITEKATASGISIKAIMLAC